MENEEEKEPTPTERANALEEKVIQLNREADNYVRELEKSMNAFENIQRFLKAHSQMNAALHVSQEVIYPPLYSDVVNAMKGIRLALRSWKRKIPKDKIE